MAASRKIQIPFLIYELKNSIIELNDYTSHEINDIILSDIKQQYEHILNNKDTLISDKMKCRFNLNKREEKIIEKIRQTYGIPLTQLYILSIIRIAIKHKIINPHEKY
jgi:hypothetical protein